MTDRETFFPNDTPTLVFEARRPDVYRSDDPDGIPAQPTDVWMRIFDGTSGEMVIVNGSDVIPLGLSPDDFLFMEPMEEPEDRGALIYVTIPPEVTAEAGNYTLYITTEYGTTRITTDQRVQIAEYR